MSPEGDHHERLFFALWPPDQVRLQIQQRLKAIQGTQSQGKPVNPDNYHMTVHFLGNIDVGRIDCFIQQAKLLTLKPFQLSLKKVGCFNKPKVFWLGCEDIPVELTQLHQDLEKALNNCGYIPELRKYHPHVTMARKIIEPIAEQSIEPVSWTIDEFVLIKSVTHPDGVEYQVRDTFGK